MNRSNLSTLTIISYFTKLPLAFLFMNKLTKPWKFNNMQFINLNMFSDFMKVLNSIRKHPTKNEYFPTHILSTTIYFLKKQKLNHNKYSEQELNMSNFLQAK
jgi:hypothetical protein